ncbi:MAG TPA: XdhC family protein [Nitrospirota bacterium]|jgi:xanthine dehydrogenase accessory factor|nr:XdhC family protein [Nitrospirota bacterium]
MKRLYREMADDLRKGESFVTATIFDKTGSAPRSDGSKMVVRSNGSIVGSVGGGRLEAEALQLAAGIFQSKQSLIQSFDLSGEDAAGMAMICGGQGEILLDYIDGKDETNRVLYDEAAAILQRGTKAWLITVLGDPKQNNLPARQQCLVRHDGTMIGKIDGDPGLLAKLLLGPGRISIHAEVRENRRFLVEPIRHGGTVYIFGAGHVSQKIAPLAEVVGFKTVVLDDRKEYANRARFAEPTELLLLESFDRLPDLDIDENSYLVIVTRGHLHDKVVLAQALRSKAGYIGMIGSRRKRDKIYEVLLKEGFVKRDLDRVYSPIGTDIGAETPEELGVSIVGELIKVRAEREQWGREIK